MINTRKHDILLIKAPINDKLEIIPHVERI
jgi:hypothetical protein